MRSKYHKEARKVVGKSEGRKLDSQECVHHKDGDITNNKINNLQIVTRSEHAKMHHRQGDLYVPSKQESERGHRFKSPYSDEELLMEIRRIDRESTRERRRLDQYKDFRRLSFTGPTVIKRRFGSWFKAKQMAGVE